jgi:UPF0755 protein
VNPQPIDGPVPRPRRWRRWLGLLLALFVVAAVALVFEAQRRLATFFKGYQAEDVFVDVPQGAGVNAIAGRLVDAGIVPDELTFRLAVWEQGAGRSLKAGEYRFAGPASPRDVVARLARGDVYRQSLTFPEGLTLREMAALFESKGFGRAGEFIVAASDASGIRDLDRIASDLEGYLFPDTYALPRSATASSLVATMVGRFREEYEMAAAASKERPASGRTVRQVVTLASLVEKETAVPAERPIVAAVYANRLRIGMGLQCDPTVIYALARAGRWSGNLTRANLQFDSPYNTYRYAGLPPGPIANPGRASIEAALAPAGVDHLYFVSRNDGSHAFAETLGAHNRNVQRFQVEYFRQQRARERADGGRPAR